MQISALILKTTRSSPLVEAPHDVADSFTDCVDSFDFLIWDVNPEKIFKPHDDLYGIQRIRIEIIHEMRLAAELGLVHAELLGDDLNSPSFNITNTKRWHIITSWVKFLAQRYYF